MVPAEKAPVVRHRQQLKRYQQGAFVLAATAVIVGGALLPSGDELLLIHVKNRQIDRARALLADGANQRVSSAASVVAHNELYLLEGRVDEALRDMEAYAHVHGRDVTAWKRLTRMYADAQRLEDQVRAAAHVYRLDPSAEQARRLATMYRWTGDEAAEGAVLHDLVRGGDATVDEHLHSARLAAALGRPQRALEAMERLRRREPGAFDYAALELYASLLLDVQGPAALAGPIHLLPIVREEPDQLAQLARALTSWGRPDAAVALFDTPPGVEAPPERMAMRARAAIGTVAASRVAHELAAMDAARPLAAAPLEALVDLCLSVGDYDTVAAVLGHSDRAADPSLTSRAIGHAVARHARNRAQALIARLGDASLSDSPILALELAAERGDVDSADAWISRIDATLAATPEQVAALAQFESRLGFKDRAFNRLATLLRSAKAPEWAAGDLSTLAAELGKVDEALRSLAASRSPGARNAWARLAVTTGRTAPVETWLTEAVVDARDAQTLRDVYVLASDKGDRVVATLAAERLFKVRGTHDDALLLGQALLAAGRPADAVGALRAASRGNTEARLGYQTALLGALQAGADVAGELRHEFWQRLSDPRAPMDRRTMLVEGLWAAGERAALLDEILPMARRDVGRWLSPLVESARAANRRVDAIAVVAVALEACGDQCEPRPGRVPVSQRHTDLVRALMELDAPDDILVPRLRRMADAEGGSWVHAYDERLARGSRTAERVGLWATIGRSMDRPREERRAAASRLVELGASVPATEILQDLVAASGPADPDVLQLLFLWGPRPGEPQIAWLMNRLREAPASDQPQWMRHILQAGPVAGARLIVTGLPTLPQDALPSLVEAWLDAHRAVSNVERLREAGEYVLARVNVSGEELRHVGRTALAHELPELATRAFTAVVTREPGDRESLRWLGALAFYEGQSERARQWLDAYVAVGGDEPESLYQLGELARNAREPERANAYFRRALERLDVPGAGAANQPLLANALVRVEQRRRAATVFETILRESPALDHVRADYAAALMQWGEDNRAHVVLQGARHSTGSDQDARSEVSGQRRLALLRVQWLTRQGQYGDALRQLDHLAGQFPADPDVLLARAGFDAERGRLAAADRGYEEARRQAPQREELERVVRLRARERAPSVTVESGSRTISDGWDERSDRLAVGAQVRPYAPLVLSIERRRVRAQRSRRADGSTAPLDADLTRVDASLTVASSAATTVGGAVFATRAGAGGGLTVALDDVRGRTEFIVETGRPFWDFLESAANDGRRDRVGVQRHWRLRPDTAAWAQFGWNRYRLASDAEARTTALTLGFVRTVRRASPAITLQYGLDKEHRTSATVANADDGQAFMPIPLLSREVHLVGAIGRFSVREAWDIETTGGYTVDRLGGRGSFLTARTSPRPGARVGLSLWVDRRRYAVATSQQVLGTGAQIVVRFSR